MVSYAYGSHIWSVNGLRFFTRLRCRCSCVNMLQRRNVHADIAEEGVEMNMDFRLFGFEHRQIPVSYF